jgi:SAM-dependent methyltransferase
MGRMSHPEQLGYFSAVVEVNRRLVEGGRILEVGSYDVNGSVRSLFSGAGEYVGVDLTPGPGVDRVGYGHEVDDPDATYDLTISGECFEHDPHWRETFANMVRLTRLGGVVAFSCASRGRPEHGTRRTARDLSPGTQAVGLDYYQNVSRRDLDELPLDEWFSEWRAWYLPTHFDLYFAGVRRGGDDGRLPSAEAVADLGAVMSLPHRAARLPLRALARTRLSESRYQDVVTPYWQTLLRFAGEGATRRQ